MAGTDELGRTDLALVAGRFGALLHDAGVPVTPERSGRFARAVALAGPLTVDDLYWCARVTLTTAAEQLPAFDAVFAAVFGGLVDPAEARGDPNAPGVGSPAAVPGDDDGARPDRLLVPTLASADERLATKDFADLTAPELAMLRRLMAGLRVALPLRVARRTQRRPTGERVDLRSTLRRSHRTGGDPVRQVRRRRRRRPRRLVLLLDISASMEPYARAYLQLLHGAGNAARAETFVFATRLTRLTQALRVANPTVALHRAGGAAPDWSGGTRIAEAVKAFLDGYGRRGMARGAVVMILSDGWERGEPEELAVQMERLSRLAHRIVWVNPRVAADGYEPLVGGMAAALPFCDVLVSGHSALALGEVVAALGPSRSVRT